MAINFNKLIILSVIIASIAGITPLALAGISTDPTNTWVDEFYNEANDFLQKSTISGNIRSYYFTRDYSNPGTSDQQAYSLGGSLGILTAPFLSGFQAGATFYTAQDLGLDLDNPDLHPEEVDQTLGRQIDVLGQLFLQYTHSNFMIRGGDQLINTPWMGPSDSRMIPATYQGIYGTWTPTQDITVTALRMFEFKSRVASTFSATNLYNPANMGQGIPALGDTTDDGAQALGLNYKHTNFVGQLWGYQFFDFAKMLYGDAQYTFKNNSKITPLIGAQAMTEGGDGDNILAQVASGAANSNALGALMGAEFPHGRLTAAWNKVFAADGFRDGDIVSPYTAGYASDPLYTTSMIAGLVEKAPGNAFKIAATLFAFSKRLTFVTSYAKYYTQPYLPNTAETDFDITYAFLSGTLKGLSLRNRLGIQTGDPSKGTFYYNRLMLQYSF